MDAVAEGEVLVGITVDIELVRVRELPLVVVRGEQRDRNEPVGLKDSTRGSAPRRLPAPAGGVRWREIGKDGVPRQLRGVVDALDAVARQRLRPVKVSSTWTWIPGCRQRVAWGVSERHDADGAAVGTRCAGRRPASTTVCGVLTRSGSTPSPTPPPLPHRPDPHRRPAPHAADPLRDDVQHALAQINRTEGAHRFEPSRVPRTAGLLVAHARSICA